MLSDGAPCNTRSTDVAKNKQTTSYQLCWEVSKRFVLIIFSRGSTKSMFYNKEESKPLLWVGRHLQKNIHIIGATQRKQIYFKEFLSNILFFVLFVSHVYNNCFVVMYDTFLMVVID